MAGAAMSLEFGKMPPATMSADPSARMDKQRVLVVGEDSGAAWAVWERLHASGYGDAVATTFDHVLEHLAEQSFDVVLVDADVEFLQPLLERLRRERPFPAIVLTGELDASRAFAYSRAGVCGYLPSIESVEQVRREVERCHAEVPAMEAMFARHVGKTRLHTLLGQARALMFEQAIAMEKGSRSGAARLLGVSRQAVQQWSSNGRRSN